MALYMPDPRSRRAQLHAHSVQQTTNKFAALDPEAAYAINFISHREAQLSEATAELNKREGRFYERVLKEQQDMAEREAELEERAALAENDMDARNNELEKRESELKEYEQVLKARAAAMELGKQDLVKLFGDLSLNAAREEIRPDVAAALRDGATQAPLPGQAVCGICVEAKVECEAEVCAHAQFCWACIEVWKTEGRRVCPVCRVRTEYRSVYLGSIKQ